MSMTGAGEGLADLVEASSGRAGSRAKHVAAVLRVKEDGEMELVGENVEHGGIGLDSGGTLRNIGSI